MYDAKKLKKNWAKTFQYWVNERLNSITHNPSLWYFQWRWKILKLTCCSVTAGDKSGRNHLFLARVMLLLFLRSKRSSSDDDVVSLLWMACFFTLKRKSRNPQSVSAPSLSLISIHLDEGAANFISTAKALIMADRRVTWKSLFIPAQSDFLSYLHLQQYIYDLAFNLVWQLLLWFDYELTLVCFSWIRFYFNIQRGFSFFPKSVLKCLRNCVWPSALKPTLYGFFLQEIYEYQKARRCSVFCSQALWMRIHRIVGGTAHLNAAKEMGKQGAGSYQ